MKGLLIKTILIISAVFLTTVFAWAKQPVACTSQDINSGICDPKDPTLQNSKLATPGHTAGTSIDCDYTDRRCLKNQPNVQSVQNAVPTVAPSSVGTSSGPSSGNADTKGNAEKNRPTERD